MNKRDKKLRVPGPRPLPLLGNVLTMTKLFGSEHTSLVDLSKQYSGIFRLHIGPFVTAVVLSDPALVREALFNKDITGRLMQTAVIIYSDNGRGIGFAKPGKSLWDTRKLLKQKLLSRQLEFNKEANAKLMREVQWLREILTNTHCRTGQAFSLYKLLRIVNMNMINNLAFSYRPANDLENPEAKKLLEAIERLLTNVGVLAMIEILVPLLENIVHWARNKQILKDREFVERYLINLVNEHSNTLDPANPRDIIDDFLIKSQEEKIDPKDMVHIIMDLLLAGTDTTSITLHWFMAFMINNPDIARKVRMEVDEKIGKETEITIEKCKECTYLMACIEETLRFKTAPLGLPHVAIEDTTLDGGRYVLPKGTLVFQLALALHTSHSLWPDPNVFRPERFENSPMDPLTKGGYWPFGVGLRRCVGEDLARLNLALHAANLMLYFEFFSVEKDGKMPMEERFGLSLNPVHLEMRVKRREV